MPKTSENPNKISIKPAEQSTESIATWPRLEFSTATGDSNIHQYIKSLEEAIAANFGVNFTALMRTGKKWTPPRPVYTVVPQGNPDYQFF